MDLEAIRLSECVPSSSNRKVASPSYADKSAQLTWGRPRPAVQTVRSTAICGSSAKLKWMGRIELSTRIAAPIERVFDLARSIDLHIASTDWTGERAIAGVIHGLIGLGQEVTWRGRHFGFMVRHTSLITIYARPTHFQDVMARGLFKSFQHDHFFEASEDATIMKDQMEFVAPLGLLGVLAERIALENHLRNLRGRRNACIQRVAESEEWKNFVPT